MTNADILKKLGLDDIKFKLFFNAKTQKPDMAFLGESKNIEKYFFGYPNKYFSFSTRFFKSPKIDKMIGGADIFFNPHFIFSPLSKKCRSVITFHDLSFERYPEFFDKKRKLWHFSNFPRDQARRADRLIAMSESTAYDLYDVYGINPKKIFIVYSGVNEDFFAEKSGSELAYVKMKYGLPDKFILSLSTIEPRKNVYGTIKAFELFKESSGREDMKLVIAGKPGWLYEKIFTAIKSSKFRDDIIYVGFVDDADKPGLYRLAEIFVYPSIYEGFGFPPLEAMASGTPVITSACSSLPEVVEDAAVLVDPFNISDIAWMLGELTEDKRVKDMFSAKGVIQAKKFSWKKSAEETLKVLIG